MIQIVKVISNLLIGQLQHAEILFFFFLQLTVSGALSFFTVIPHKYSLISCLLGVLAIPF